MADEPEACEKATVGDETRLMVQESRTVLPGLQALFGFQFVAAFNATFDQLPAVDKRLHALALVLTALAGALLMTPAAYQRVAERGWRTVFFVRLGSRLLEIAMVPLALSLSIEVYVVLHRILESAPVAIAIAGALAAVLFALWIVYPRRGRRRAPGPRWA